MRDNKIITDDDPPVNAYSTHYIVKYYCDNCSEFGRVMILKGVRQEGFEVLCKNCGCKIKLKKG